MHVHLSSKLFLMVDANNSHKDQSKWIFEFILKYNISDQIYIYISGLCQINSLGCRIDVLGWVTVLSNQTYMKAIPVTNPANFCCNFRSPETI